MGTAPTWPFTSAKATPGSKVASAFFRGQGEERADRQWVTGRFFTPVKCQLPPCIWDNLLAAQVSNQNSPQLPTCLPAVDPNNWIIHSEAIPVNKRPPHSKAERRRRLKINHSEMFQIQRVPSAEQESRSKGLNPPTFTSVLESSVFHSR